MNCITLDSGDLDFARECFGFYDKLSQSEISTLERAITRLRFPKGATLRSRDADCLGVLLVREGVLRAYIASDDGREVTLYRLGAGEVCILSASCVLNNINFDVSIEADSDVDVLKIGLGAFDSLVKNNVWVENFSYKNAIERFGDVMWAVEQVMFMRFDKRLAIFLLDESGRSIDGEIRATHEQIAKYVGSAREVVSRMLKSFESQGLLEVARGSIKVRDRDGLRKLTA